MKKYLLVLLLLFTSLAHAQTQVAIQKATANVYSSPSTKSEVLVTLKKGSRVDVAGVTETGWAKIKVTVSGFQFEGWIRRDAITKPKTAAAPKAVPAKKAPTPTAKSSMSSSSSSQLEQFFEPSSSSASTPAPAPQDDQFIRNEEKPSKPKKTKEPKTGSNWKDGRLVLTGVPGYAIHQYTFSDATRDAFRYNITGPTVILGAEYKAFEFFDDLIRAGLQFQAQYMMLNTKTNLLDGTNTQFSDLTAKNKAVDAWLKAKIMVNFDRIVGKPFLIGLTGGYEYMRFWGDDVIDDNDVPVGLYVDQRTTSIPVGVLAELLFLDPVVLTLGADVLMKNSTKENPDGSSGTQPNTKMGFAPYFYLNFPIVGETHYMGIRYQLRVQETTFTGLSTSRVNNELNEASALSVFHTLGLEYSYHF